MTVKAALLIAALSGVVTYYPADVYGGNPLYCDTWETELEYNESLSFVALPIGANWLCGDLVVIRFLDGTRIITRALDSGTFKDNCVLHDNGECVPILADLPEHLWPYDTKYLSARASILNVSLINRLLEDAKIGYLIQQD